MLLDQASFQRSVQPFGQIGCKHLYRIRLPGTVGRQPSLEHFVPLFAREFHQAARHQTRQRESALEALPEAPAALALEAAARKAEETSEAGGPYEALRRRQAQEEVAADMAGALCRSEVVPGR